jgi:hypothetical protein
VRYLKTGPGQARIRSARGKALDLLKWSAVAGPCTTPQVKRHEGKAKPAPASGTPFASSARTLSQSPNLRSARFGKRKEGHEMGFFRIFRPTPSKSLLPKKIRAAVLGTIKPMISTPGLPETLADRITIRIGELLSEEELI